MRGEGRHEIYSVLYQHMLLPETKEIIQKYGKLVYWCNSTVAQKPKLHCCLVCKMAGDNVPGLKMFQLNYSLLDTIITLVTETLVSSRKR